jgi:hypothetical protein
MPVRGPFARAELLVVELLDRRVDVDPLARYLPPGLTRPPRRRGDDGLVVEKPQEPGSSLRSVNERTVDLDCPVHGRARQTVPVQNLGAGCPARRVCSMGGGQGEPGLNDSADVQAHRGSP